MEVRLPGGRRIGIGKSTVIRNPAWDFVKEIPMDDLMSRYGEYQRASFALDDGVFTDFRHRFTSRWTWAIPDPNALEFIVETLDGRPVVEMGAGNGYWAWMLSQYGVDVVAYDHHPIGHEKSWFGTEAMHAEERWPKSVEVEEYFPVQEGSVEMLSLLDDCAERVLFLCWPNYDTDFAYDAVKAFRGDTVIYIGEGNGGCTANWKFWALMEGTDEYGHFGMEEGDVAPDQEWEFVEHHDIEQWSGLRDHIRVYKRKV